MKTITTITLAALMPTLSLADESWTGFNAGLQLSTIDVSDGNNDNGNAALGLHAGYLHDFDGYVIGGELTYDAGAEVESGGKTEKVDTVRLKFKGGHVFGRTYLYGVVGYANIDGGFKSEDGYSAGVGATYRATDKILVGLEYLRDAYDTSGDDITADSVALRVSYKF
ncbi:Outer membrane protein beta-barrel domain-containing protein [Ruegeria halocynthiae]|uniref:Outer membrane protein beta-barrel domain-containing protein n=1 Tax=Ruegeria halocynthiae TaxID=985054 RepID=A0A1H3ECX8_9RHOB|nr:porin family protein [Ruegeria halocynthiae]SDX76612.1 Outer membrane protein beta-barrel domain-containing protein [Ruegeria halocynthiae]